MKRKTFTSIQQIQAHRFIGNHADDCAAFDAIYDFVADTRNTVADRAEAIRVGTEKGMGIRARKDEQRISDRKLVAQYLSDVS